MRRRDVRPRGSSACRRLVRESSSPTAFVSAGLDYKIPEDSGARRAPGGGGGGLKVSRVYGYRGKRVIRAKLHETLSFPLYTPHISLTHTEKHEPTQHTPSLVISEFTLVGPSFLLPRKHTHPGKLECVIHRATSGPRHWARGPSCKVSLPGGSPF